jgi:hypothetical protein
MEKYKSIEDYINQNLSQVDSFKGEPIKKVKISKRQKKKNRHKKEMGN